MESSPKKMVSIVTPCFNEQENVGPLAEAVRREMQGLAGYEYEHIFIDNASTDRTVPILKEIAAKDKRVKVIVNARNFGHIRSPFYGLLQATGDAVILMAADFQDPPALIPSFIKKWEEGFRVVVGVKTSSEESPLFYAVRRAYYSLVGKLADVELIPNFTGFGLYDRQVIQVLRGIDDPYPYFRGLICDIGFEKARIEFVQPTRKRGFTKNNFYTLYDIAMLGITNHSKVPLRLATMLGFGLSLICLLVALAYLVAKLVFWNTYTIGTAPVIVGLFFFASVQLMFIGILGEYIGSIHTKVLRRPLVVEKERINFD